MRFLFVLVAAALLLTACGQKGPLYLPESSSTPTHASEMAA